MYRAKQAGRGRYEVFDKHLEVCVTSKQEQERELRTALDKRQFAYLYQPIYVHANGKRKGLSRCFACAGRMESIDNCVDLLSVAENTGLSLVLGQETLEAVCAQLRSWSESLPQKDLMVTINLTRRQFYNHELISLLRKALAVSGAYSSRLLFEVPESALNENSDAAVAVLQRLADCDVRVAVDDFGSSLAPLNLLLQLPVSIVKLAPRLTAAAVSPGRQLIVLEALIRVANKLGLQVVAQGIETAEQLTALTRLGCTLGQGPLLSPALDPAQVLGFAQAGWRAVASKA